MGHRSRMVAPFSWETEPGARNACHCTPRFILSILRRRRNMSKARNLKWDDSYHMLYPTFLQIETEQKELGHYSASYCLDVPICETLSQSINFSWRHLAPKTYVWHDDCYNDIANTYRWLDFQGVMLYWVLKLSNCRSYHATNSQQFSLAYA